LSGGAVQSLSRQQLLCGMHSAPHALKVALHFTPHALLVHSAVPFAGCGQSLASQQPAAGTHLLPHWRSPPSKPQVTEASSAARSPQLRSGAERSCTARSPTERSGSGVPPSPPPLLVALAQPNAAHASASPNQRTRSPRCCICQRGYQNAAPASRQIR
jgi:hypothetical protein